MKKIALDHDSTLAATATVAFDLIHGPNHDYTYDDVESWSWGLDEFGAERYLSALWHAWTLRPLWVPTLEDDLSNTVADLREEYTVHIVTAHPDHPGITEGKKRWLRFNGISYDDFVVVPARSTKADLDYDYYIDDKPALPERVQELRPTSHVYLRDQPYNRDIVDAEHVTRVHSVAEVRDALLE